MGSLLFLVRACENIFILTKKRLYGFWLFHDSKGGNSSVVERYLAKVDVAGSTPVSRSKRFLRRHSQAVRQRSAKSPSPVQIRVSPPSFFRRNVGRFNWDAGVVEQVDTRDLKSLGCITRAGSSPASGTISLIRGNSSVVERYLAKVDVAGSTPVSRSIFL